MHVLRLVVPILLAGLSTLGCATTVANLLAQAGVQAGRASAEGRGKREPVTTNCPQNMAREKLIACLQPDRRVTIEVRGVIR